MKTPTSHPMFYKYLSFVRSALFTLIICLIPLNALSLDVTLSWNEHDDAAHYILYWGETSRDYTNNSGSISNQTTTYTVTNLENKKYYFSVKAFNNCGNSSDYSDEISNEVNGNDTNLTPTAVINTPSSDQTVTEGTALSFTGTGSGGDGTLTHTWNFGTLGIDPVTGADAGSITFSTPGSHTVTYTVTDEDGDSASDTKTITVQDSVTSVQITNPSSSITIAEGQNVNFSASVLSGNEPFTYNWNFGSSNIPSSSSLSPGSKVFGEPGTYTVTFTATDNDGDTDSDTVTITVSDNAPVVSICPDSIVNSVSEGSVLNFCSSVTGGDQPYSYQWNFGNSTTSQSAHPTNIQFSEHGNYEVSVTVTDVDGDSSTASMNLTVTDNQPVATIASPSLNTTVNVNESVTFTGSFANGNEPYTHSWNFGTNGPSPSSEKSPGEVVFTTPGTYNVVYTITDADGDTDTDAVVITVNNQEPDTVPVAEISSPSGNSATLNEGESITFSGSVDNGNAPFTYLWTFGNNGPAPSNSLSPGSVSFPTKGTYVVTFTVTDAQGQSSSDTLTVTVNEVIVDTMPVASIVKPSEDQTINEGESVNFEADITGGNAPFIYNWSFGTGGPADYNQEDPGDKTFSNSGEYTITLTVTDSDGDVSSDSVLVTVKEPVVDTTPIATITAPAENISMTTGDTVTFEGSITGGNAPFSYAWNFGQGGPDAVVVEDPGQIAFNAEGVYTVTFTTVDVDGDTHSDSVTVNVNDPTIDTIPVVSIVSPAAPMIINEGEPIFFKGDITNGNAPFTYHWSFGKGGPDDSTELTPGNVTFNTQGNYGVVLTVTDADGDMASALITVQVNEVVPDTTPYASIDSPATNVIITQGESLAFDGRVTDGNAPFTYLWDFKGSQAQSFTTEDPGTLSFNQDGEFEITFTVTDKDGDSSTASTTVTVKALIPDSAPTAIIAKPGSNAMISEGDSLTFVGKAQGGNAPYTFSWHVDNMTSALVRKDKRTITFDDAGNYLVTLTVTDSDGDEDTATCSVVVTEEEVDTDGDGVKDSQDAFPSDPEEWADDDNDGIGNNSDTDKDNDGMDDAWETQHGLNPDENDADLDKDNDGISNLDEFKDNTDPSESTDIVAPVIPDTDTDEFDVNPILTIKLSDFGSSGSNLITRWQISLDAAFTSLLMDIKKSADGHQLQVPRMVLNHGTKYFWRVRVIQPESQASTKFRSATGSAWSNAQAFTTGASAKVDENNNGIPDDIEIEGNSDIDSDGTIDKYQGSIKPFMSATGSSVVGISVTSPTTTIETVDNIKVNAIENKDDMPKDMPIGLVGFRLKVSTPGETVQVKVSLSEPASENMAWFKYDSVNGWKNYDNNTLFSSTRKALLITLTDGGEGDADGVANGYIVDPGGLGSTSNGGNLGAEALAESCFIETLEEKTINFNNYVFLLALLLSCGIILKRRNA